MSKAKDILKSFGSIVLCLFILLFVIIVAYDSFSFADKLSNSLNQKAFCKSKGYDFYITTNDQIREGFFGCCNYTYREYLREEDKCDVFDEELGIKVG